MGENMGGTLFKNLALLDSDNGTLKSDHQVLVRGNEIAAVSRGPINAGKAREIDLGGRTLMPGLIDCHVHITAVVVKWAMESTRHLQHSYVAGAALAEPPRNASERLHDRPRRRRSGFRSQDGH